MDKSANAILKNCAETVASQPGTVKDIDDKPPTTDVVIYLFKDYFWGLNHNQSSVLTCIPAERVKSIDAA